VSVILPMCDIVTGQLSGHVIAGLSLSLFSEYKFSLSRPWRHKVGVEA